MDKDDSILGDVNRLVVDLPEPLDDYTSVFSQPYHMIYLSRRCEKQCSFISREWKRNKPFSQKRMDHIWLNQSGLEHLQRISRARLYPNTIPVNPQTLKEAQQDRKDATVAVQGVIITRQSPVTYTYTGQETYFSSSESIPFHTGYKPNPMNFYNTAATSAESETNYTYIHPTLVVGYTPHSHIRINHISATYSDYKDFLNRVHTESSSSISKTWDRRRPFPIAFTPPCNQLHPGAINFLTRLIELTKMHVYGGCLANKEIEKGQVLNDNKKQRMASAYRFVLVWEPVGDVEGYVSETFYKALAYSALPIVWGAKDVEDFVPTWDGVVYVRDFVQGLDGPERLASHLESIGGNETEWMRRMSWRVSRRFSANSGFLRLWSWSLPQAVCKICAGVTEIIEERANEVKGAVGHSSGLLGAAKKGKKKKEKEHNGGFERIAVEEDEEEETMLKHPALAELGEETELDPDDPFAKLPAAPPAVESPPLADDSEVKPSEGVVQVDTSGAEGPEPNADSDSLP
ncbi:4-alpha-L-fucosyltransferase [Chytridiales sp. JEL 0842]|nr:4-alpha-L-fucosyltransferase [Chytridiales sp. JEL 0842]